VRSRSDLTAICDAGPVIHLDELDCLDLLSDFAQVMLPEKVRQEIERYRRSALKNPRISFMTVGRRTHFDGSLLAMSRSFALDAGETEALILMKEIPNAIFLTDDSAARLAANQMGLEVHVTIGILVRAIRRGYRKPEEVFQALSELPRKSTLYIKPSLLEESILKIKHEFGL
jgi:predicted nucleic acid-binding protein